MMVPFGESIKPPQASNESTRSLIQIDLWSGILDGGMVLYLRNVCHLNEAQIQFDIGIRSPLKY